MSPTPRRPDWRTYFLDIAQAVSARGDCIRDQVGAVLVDRHRRVVSTGFNGAPAGEPGCLEGHCERCNDRDVLPGADYDKCLEIHAEANALLYASWSDCQGATLYVTREPCAHCYKLARGAGVAHVEW